MIIEQVDHKDNLTPEKLKKYKDDSTIFVVYNIYKTMLGLYATTDYALSNAPSYDECYKIRPFKAVYERALNSGTELGLENLCMSISSGRYTLIRMK